ncbi:MAG: galactose oxidase-like domain-containing protein [Pseudonocardia sp.]
MEPDPTSPADSPAPISPAMIANDPAWAQVGRWDPVFPLPNVAIHTHVLPSGTVLFWGRRDDPAGSMNEHACTAHVWDPATGASTPTPQPTLADGTTVNLFCSGHTFLPDGRLLVAGGHLTDGDGVNQACTYDHATNTWTALPVMNSGRWYPTATTLADGRVLVSSGSAASNGTIVVNDVPQIWDGTRWQPTVNFIGLPLYPRMHVAPDAQVFMSGSNATTYLLNTDGGGTWTPLPGSGGSRQNGERQYAPSVMYEPGKVIYIGGGNDAGTDLPTAATEVIDLGATPPAWQGAASMALRRRQHNATILADGTVLVTGGTSGPGFNDLSPGRPVHVAELWNPATGVWTELAAEDVDRCYHATAVLLPDATVLSAGGGEFMVGNAPNDPADTHRDAQIFHPPYLFQGPRPQISAVPAEITHGEDFPIEVQGPEIARVTVVRLPSVTHAFDENQRIDVLTFNSQGSTLTATAPAGPGSCPPGHYMLFVLSTSGVPSVARIVRIAAPAAGVAAAVTSAARNAPPPRLPEKTHTQERDDAVRTRSTGTRVTVGLTAKCPYGLGPCWGGAYEALTKLDGVAAVRPIANTTDSTAEVYLTDQGLPDLDRWPEQIARWANGSYDFRGVEVTIAGTVTEHDGVLRLTGPTLPASVQLLALRRGTELPWDLSTRRSRPAPNDERDAHRHLMQRCRQHSAGLAIRVTGPARKTSDGWSLLVRTVEDEPPPAG